MFETLQQDLKDFHGLSSRFWQRVPDDAWQRKTGTREKDWTLLETLAHILSFAQAYNKFVDAGLRDEPATFMGANDTRDDLAQWNQREIERLAVLPPNGLIVQLLQEWRITSEKVAQLTPETAQWTVAVPAFDRPATLIDLIDFQLSHAGVVHGTQIAVPLGQAPFWQQFMPDLTARMIDRFLRQWQYIYWSAYGPSQETMIAFQIDGAGGGNWYLRFSQAGCISGHGTVQTDHRLIFTSSDIFLGVFTNALPFQDAIMAGDLRFAGDMSATLPLLALFTPKRPKR